ncbi:MAG TPA: alcohol dehydrogenase [Saprospiraceae bacterium]|nr:alcohol dehydrogenase [Saprospiraceae bacterium]
MKALQLTKIKQPLVFTEVSDPKPSSKQVIVHLKAAALNHRDLWIQQGQYAGIHVPIVLGSDGAGILEGEKVIINPSLHWYKQSPFPPKSFKILGLPDAGTFAQQVAVPSKNIFPMPAHLSFEEAAALPLAGITAYRVLFSRCRTKKKDRVLISGIGGGVALMACQLAIAHGNEVWVTSSSKAKIKKAVELGAKGGFLYTEKDWYKKASERVGGGFDAIIDSAAGDGFGDLVKLANSGARIGIYGGTRGKINGVIPQIVFWKQISILGSTMGSGQEFAKMLQLVNQHKIVPVVDSVNDLPQGNLAFRKMASGKQFGKIVLKM